MVHNYWHGNGSLLQTGCECGLNKSCAKILHETKCNCDSYLENMTDKGMLTSMENLPVKKLNYGGAFSSSSSIQFNLGPLVCSGKSKPYASEYLDIMKKQIEMIINTNESQKALIEKNQNRASQSVVLFIARSPSSEPAVTSVVTSSATSVLTTSRGTATTTSRGTATTIHSTSTPTTSDYMPRTRGMRLGRSLTLFEEKPPSGYENGEKL